jgi:uncharacterized protein (DUF983 family)
METNGRVCVKPLIHGLKFEGGPVMASIFTTLFLGARGLCPRCARGRIFTGWYNLREQCDCCGLVYEPHTGTTWGFMYVTNAALTGAIIVLMLLIRPSSILQGQIVVGIAAVGIAIGTLPYRKGMAISIDYIIDSRFGGT